jgi:hypothetical protein
MSIWKVPQPAYDLLRSYLARHPLSNRVDEAKRALPDADAILALLWTNGFEIRDVNDRPSTTHDWDVMKYRDGERGPGQSDF